MNPEDFADVQTDLNLCSTHMPTCAFCCIRPQIVVMDNKWASSRENLSSGFPTKQVSNQRLASEFEISPVASFHMVLSKKRMTKALIRLRECAGWSAPVLFANPRRQVLLRRGPNRRDG